MLLLPESPFATLFHISELNHIKLLITAFAVRVAGAVRVVAIDFFVTVVVSEVTGIVLPSPKEMAGSWLEMVRYNHPKAV